MLEDEETAELLKKLSVPGRDRPPGSRSILSQATTEEKILWFIKTPIRALMCLSLVTIFFLTYFGFMIPVMWARKVWPRLYWFVEGKLYRWLQGFIGTWGYTAGYDVFEYGDDLTPYYRDERVLLMCNHQSTADVPTLMACLQSKGVASRKVTLLMEISVHRIMTLKQHLQDVFWDRDRRWVIVFPEGGFYYKRVESSQRYGKLNGFPHLKYTTLPRMGAVKAILEELGPRGDSTDETRERSSSKLKQLADTITDTVGAIREKKYVKETRPPIRYVLDVTIAYPNGIPLSLATLGFGTREKCDIAVNYKIYNADEVPFNDEEKLRDWMYSVYKEKDEMLGIFMDMQADNHDFDSSIYVNFSYKKFIFQEFV
ncbi:PlsC domain-containing protein [Trichostrongylus colubriformis]|uniref:PlsC domain-containing protein n=1 Tax=Trichostrongylus colubriformis TaxID=6319 RepID=A0AAN8FZ78_TRICO